MSLADCIRTAGKALDKKDSDAIMSLVEQYREQGMDEAQAERQAVQDHINSIGGELDTLASRVEEAGGTVQREEVLFQPPVPPPDKVAEVRKTKDGRFYGGPRGLTTAKEMKTIVRRLVKLATDPMSVPERSAWWYEESGRYIASLAQGDAVLQERMLRLVAYFSQATQLGGNAKFLVDAAYQMARGEEVRTGRFPEAMAPTIKEIIEADEMNKALPDVNDKVMSFYRNLKDGATGLNEYAQESTIDRWMWEVMGYKGGREHSAGSAQYAFAREVMIEAAEELSKKTGNLYLPRNVQAMLWTFQRNTENAQKAEKKGKLDEFEPVSLHLGDYLENATGMMTFEAVPSTSTPLFDAFEALDQEQKQSFLEAALALVNDLPEMLGMPLATQGTGRGMWEGVTNPSAYMGAVLEGGITKGYNETDLDLMASVLGYIYNQDAVLWHRPQMFGAKKPKNAAAGVSITFDQDVDANALAKHLSDYGVIGFSEIRRPDGRQDFRILRLPEEGEKAKARREADQGFIRDIQSALNSFESEATFDMVDFTASYGMPENNWTEQPNGEGYLQRISESGRSDLSDWASDRRQEFISLLESNEQARGGRGILPVRPDGRVQLTHYSGRSGLTELDPAFHGTGIAGAESRRKVNDSNYWVDRTYYGLPDYTKEPRLGGNTYSASIAPESLYDMDNDPEGLFTQAKSEVMGQSAYSLYEKLIKDAGYSGYFSQKAQAVAVFEKLPVETDLVLNQPDMSQEARMQRAEAMGFDTSKVWWHGSPTPGFQEFDPGKINPNDPDMAIQGFWFTTDRGDALRSGQFPWGRPNADNAEVRPFFVRGEIAPYSEYRDIAVDKSVMFPHPSEHEAVTEELKSRGYSGVYRKAPWSEEKIAEGRKALEEQGRWEASDNMRFEGRDYEGQTYFDYYNKGGHVAGGYTIDEIMQQFGSGTLVMFNPSDIRSVDAAFNDSDTSNLLSQDNRGYIAISPTRQMRIGILEDADLSTFIHETGHFFLEVMKDNIRTLQGLKKVVGSTGLTDNQTQMLKDGETILKWLGVESWDDIEVVHHEKWARGFERYVGEGNAPSVALRRAFHRFRSWMLSIYKDLKNLDVTLNDDVRGVFDRMLASDEEIEAARNELELTPIFTDAATHGMTDAEFRNYQRIVEDANRSARENLEQKLMREYSRERRKWWREETARVQAEVEDELGQRREYIAASVLRTGNKPDGTPHANIKFDRDALKEMVSDEDLTKLRRMGTYAVEGGLHPEQVATLLDYPSATDLINDLLELTPMRDEVRRITRERMTAEHGDLMRDGSIEQEAKLAVSTEMQQKIIEAEIKALRKLQGQTRPFVETAQREQRQAASAGVRQIRDLPGLNAIREMAKGMIAQQRYRDIRPNTYLVAARKAGNQAVEAAAKGDYMVAASLKQRQSLNLELYRQAVKAREEADKIVSYARGITKKGPGTRLAKTGYLPQVLGILERFNLRPLSNEAVDRQKSLAEFVQEQAEAGLPIELPEEIVNEANRKHYKDMTMDELRGLRDSLKHLDHMSKLKNRLLKSRDERTFNEFRDALDQSMQDNRMSREAAAKKVDAETNIPFERLGKWWKGFVAMHRKIASYARVFDGLKDGGLAWNAFVRPFNDAANAEAEMRMIYSEKLHDIFSDFTGIKERAKVLSAKVTGGKFGGGLFRREYYPELETDRFSGKMSHMGKIMMALNWGTEGNRQRLLDGYGWSTQNVQTVLNTLSQEDWAFVEQVWDVIDSLWPEVKKVSERIDGFAAEKVEGIEVATPFGTIQGKYFPATYDHEHSVRSRILGSKQEVEQVMAGATIRASTRHGFRKARAEKVVGRPIRLDPNVIFAHINDVIHDITHAEVLIDANRLIRDDAINRTITDQYGAEVYDQFISFLDDVATGDKTMRNAFERGMLWMRAGVSIAGMGFNMITAAIQITGYSQSVVRIGEKWAAIGLKDFYSHPIKTGEMILEKSSLMRQRNRTQLREINEIQNTLTGGNNLTGAAFYMIVKMQQTVDMPTWMGQYRKSLANGASEADAVAQADQAVLDSQMGGQVKDLAAIQRGSPLLKLFTAFYSYFNATFNLTSESFARVQKPRDVPRFIVDMLFLYTVPAVLGMLIRDAMTPGDDDDEEDFLERAMFEQLSFALGTMVGFRELSGVAQGFYGYSGPAGTRFFAELSKLATQVGQGEVDEPFLRSLNQAGGIMFHYPAVQVDRTVRGIIALQEGETDNPVAILTGPPRKN